MAALLEKPVKRTNPLTHNKLTIKQAGFVKDFIETQGNGTQAALRNYNTDNQNVANQIALGNLRNPTIISEIHDACRDIGLNPRVILGRLQDVLKSDNLPCVVSSAQVINNMTGWNAPTKQDLTFRVGAPEHCIVGGYCE